MFRKMIVNTNNNNIITPFKYILWIVLRYTDDNFNTLVAFCYFMHDLSSGCRNKGNKMSDTDYLLNDAYDKELNMLKRQQKKNHFRQPNSSEKKTKSI